MHNERLCNKNACCGCGACKDICQAKAISLSEDIEGFFYPAINEEICINCGMCNSVCPIINLPLNINDKQYVQQYYAVRNKDANILQESTSGGIFTALSERIITDGGVIYGVVFDSHLIPKYELIDKKEELYKYHGAKYVQAYNNVLMRKIREELRKKRHVLASGTPCMIAALKNFVKSDQEKEFLITVDIVCHGVPSPGVWSAFLEYLKQKKAVLKACAFATKN